jgi:hypothetical protein
MKGKPRSSSFIPQGCTQRLQSTTPALHPLRTSAREVYKLRDRCRFITGNSSATFSTGSALILASLSSAEPSPARCSTGEEAVAELRAYHEADRRAHLEGKVELMTPGMADRIVLVSNGNLSVNSKTRQQASSKAILAECGIWSGATRNRP